MSTAWYGQQKTYYAKRLKKANPFHPENRVILLERDERHATPENPRGILVVSEGRTFRAYPTAAVKRLVGISIEEVKPGAAKSRGTDLAPDAITSILDDEALVRVLSGEGLETVPELVERWVSGRLDSVHGIGAARKAKIRSALLEAGLIKVDADELDKQGQD